jgi:predicted ribosomally synthesized peptide with nif11-like leader
MSIVSARAFIAKITDEEGFRKQLVGELLKRRMELVKEAGFEFSEKDLDEALSAFPPGALGHGAAWFCNTLSDGPSQGGPCCSTGLWH